MQINGDGTPVDIAGARASLNRYEHGGADAMALDAIITKREANPNATGPRIEFCKDVASTTNSREVCRSGDEAAKSQKGDAQLKRIRAGLDQRLRPAFDRARAAFARFVTAEGHRAYAECDGIARSDAAMDQEALARKNHRAAVRLIVTGPALRLAGGRVFAQADEELNAVYREKVRSYVSEHEALAKSYEEDAAKTRKGEWNSSAFGASSERSNVAEYKVRSRAAQHDWVRYRDAMAELAAARWPDAATARDPAKALLTEDRIRELRGE
jgi:hypothetical protein